MVRLGRGVVVAKMAYAVPHDLLVKQESDSTPTRDLRPSTDLGFSDDQVVRHRHEDWRIQHDEGVRGIDGRHVRRSVRLIARIAMVPKSTVQDGIAQARALRKAHAHASRLQDR